MSQDKTQDLVADGWQLDQTYLYFIAAEDHLIERVSDVLRNTGYAELGNSLAQLSQDIGVEIIGSVADEEPAGPDAARVLAAYTPVTSERLRLIAQAADKLTDPALKSGLQALIKTLPGARQQPQAKHNPDKLAP